MKHPLCQSASATGSSAITSLERGILSFFSRSLLGMQAKIIHVLLFQILIILNKTEASSERTALNHGARGTLRYWQIRFA
jgi:hypothetical protein